MSGITAKTRARKLATMPYELEERIEKIQFALEHARDPAGQKREMRLREKVARLEEDISILTGYHRDGKCRL